jgi:CRISPR/Cas system CMR-associated protein Cmr1 (group 7 of RAMP superfamily)
MSYLSLEKCIDEANKYLNSSIKHAEKDINDLKSRIKIKDSITKKDYDMFFAQINQRLNHANSNIEKFTREKSEIIKKANDHIDNILNMNEHIKTVADNALVELYKKFNKKYLEKQSLAHLSAMTLKSLGVKKTDLPSPVQEVYERNVSPKSSPKSSLKSSLKGGKKQIRKTKKRL